MYTLLNNLIKIIMLTLFLFIISGCATGQTFLSPKNISKDKSTVYFYAPLVLYGAAVYYDINITNKKNTQLHQAKLENNGYLKYNLTKGQYTINVKLDLPNILYFHDIIDFFGTYKDYSIKVNITNNTLYCYKFHFKHVALNSVIPTIMKIEKEECLDDLSTKKESVYY